MKKYRTVEYLRYTVQSIAAMSFLLSVASLSYPPGPETAVVQWFSRLDPWALLSQLRWQQVVPYWIGIPLLTLAATWFGGRIFCGWLCPLGALLTLTDKCCRAIGKNMPLIGVRALPELRNYWLLLLVAVFLLGSNWVLFLTPFALFSHELVRIGYRLMPWMLIGILASTLFFSRLWCSALCPTGLVLSLAARRRLFGYQAAGDCIHCGKCSGVCPVGAMAVGDGGAREWCLTCGSCTYICPTKAICWQPVTWRQGASLTAAGRVTPSPVAPARRQFFKVAFTIIMAAVLWKKSNVRAGAPLLRPPGALPDTDFSAVCNRCGRCIQICPAKALCPVPITDGLADFETPHLIPRKMRCDLCMSCQQVCPTGAIAQVPLSNVRIGKASIARPRCLAWSQQKLCFVCGEQCPVLAIQGDELHRPTVLTDKCVGCGACEHSCPVDGEAAIRIFPNKSFFDSCNLGRDRQP